MAAKYTNLKDIPLSAAVWLAHDKYDHNPDDKSISATSLMKPIKQLCLAPRAASNSEAVLEDISGLVASGVGTAIHDSIETAWEDNYKESLKDLGYPPGLIKRIRVNPDPATVTEDDVCVYMEQRSSREVLGFEVSGKFDFVGDGRLEDFKSTSTYTYTHKTNDEKYQLQGSIYRWLNPDIITDDEMSICFIFMDWSANQAMSNKNYPQSRVMGYPIPLLSLEETQAYVERKLRAVIKYQDAPEEDMPPCTDDELWRSAPVFKYYKNPATAAKKGRSTKNFDNIFEANQRLLDDGSVGVVVEVKGTVKACKYCPAFSECKQKNEYINDGSLKI